MKILVSPSVTTRHKEKMVAKMAAENVAKDAAAAPRRPTRHQGWTQGCQTSEVE